jgi:hypothetical protein
MKNTKMCNYYLIAFLLFVAALLYLYTTNKKEPFTTRINQFVRPHYRNTKTFVSETINNTYNGAKRYLRQTGIL